MFTFNVHECGVQLNMMGHISVSSCHNNMLQGIVTSPLPFLLLQLFGLCTVRDEPCFHHNTATAIMYLIHSQLMQGIMMSKCLG